MTTRNDITGDRIQSKANNQAYRDNHDKIFTQTYLKAIADICPSDQPIYVTLDGGTIVTDSTIEINTCPSVQPFPFTHSDIDKQIRDIQELIKDEYK